MTVVAHIIEIKQLGSTSSRPGERSNSKYPLVDSRVKGGTETPVPAVVFHGKTAYRLFTLPVHGMPLELGDIIQTSANTVLGISFVLGGEVGVNAGSIVKIDGERSVAVENVTLPMILRRQLGIWAKVAKHSTPVLIQTNGGVMGIKG